MELPSPEGLVETDLTAELFERVRIERHDGGVSGVKKT
jgi:hypothetical protein